MDKKLDPGALQLAAIIQHHTVETLAGNFTGIL